MKETLNKMKLKMKSLLKSAKSMGKKEGFYIGLFATLCVVVVAGTVVYKQINSNKETSKPNVSTPKEKEITLNKTNEEANNKVIENSERVQKQEKPKKEAKKGETKAVTSQNLKFINPVEGKIIKGNDEAVISEDGMRAEFISGVTLESKIGTEVKSAEVGIVEDVKHDDVSYGSSITIKHPNGVKTQYCNLDKNIKLNKGDKVKKGQAIGKVGKTAEKLVLNFKADLFHLKVKVMKDGKYIDVDPMKYFSFKK